MAVPETVLDVQLACQDTATRWDQAIQTGESAGRFDTPAQVFELYEVVQSGFDHFTNDQVGILLNAIFGILVSRAEGTPCDSETTPCFHKLAHLTMTMWRAVSDGH